jgi:hypothetical protein
MCGGKIIIGTIDLIRRFPDLGDGGIGVYIILFDISEIIKTINWDPDLPVYTTIPVSTVSKMLGIPPSRFKKIAIEDIDINYEDQVIIITNDSHFYHITFLNPAYYSL